jgi:spermidine synthase
VIPWETLERARAPDGTELVLARRGDELAVRAGGHVLMSSRQHGSEEELAVRALAGVEGRRDVLVGGLGMGFTLRAVLDRVPTDCRVVVVELVAAVAAWNRGPLSALAGHPLDDRRVTLEVGDVAARIAAARGRFDAILLDVDNGPAAVAHDANDRLYGEAGVAACARALREGGALGVWSAGPDARYLSRLSRAGLEATAGVAAARPGSGARHVVFVARRLRQPETGAPSRGAGRGAPRGRRGGPHT